MCFAKFHSVKLPKYYTDLSLFLDPCWVYIYRPLGHLFRQINFRQIKNLGHLFRQIKILYFYIIF